MDVMIEKNKQPEKKTQNTRDYTFDAEEHECNAKLVNWELLHQGNPVLTLKKPRQKK
jgi:hypothetical protein